MMWVLAVVMIATGTNGGGFITAGSVENAFIGAVYSVEGDCADMAAQIEGTALGGQLVAATCRPVTNAQGRAIASSQGVPLR